MVSYPILNIWLRSFAWEEKQAVLQTMSSLFPKELTLFVKDLRKFKFRSMKRKIVVRAVGKSVIIGCSCSLNYGLAGRIGE